MTLMEKIKDEAYKIGCDLAESKLYKASVDVFAKVEDYFMVKAIEQAISKEIENLRNLKKEGKITLVKYIEIAKNYLSYQNYAKKIAENLENKIKEKKCQ